MANTIGWGKATQNNDNGFGKYQNTIGAASIYAESYAGETAVVGTSAAFSYSASSYNQGEADPTPTITGTTGGFFTSDAGVSFIDTSTGQIDLSASTIATHAITYIVDGVQSTQNVGITAAPYSSTRSFSFDGINDYFISDLDGTSTGGVLAASDSDVQLSISVWFKITSSATGKGILQWANALSDSTPFLVLRRATSTTINTYLDGSYQSTVNVNDNQWYNSIIIRTSSDNTWRGYLNGSSTAWFSHNDGGNISFRNQAESLYLGNGFNGYFAGNIDEVSIWNSALSSDAITEIYNSGAPNDLTSLTNASSTNLVAWYKMGE